jgi:hypothetical protein
MAQKSASTIKVKPRYKSRVHHKPTRVFRDRKKYTRKGKTATRRKKELSEKADSDPPADKVDKK